MPRMTRVIAFGLLWLALASSALQALPSGSYPRATPRAESGDLLAVAWEWLASILVPRPDPTDRDNSARSKEGSQLDPDGHH